MKKRVHYFGDGFGKFLVHSKLAIRQLNRFHISGSPTIWKTANVSSRNGTFSSIRRLVKQGTTCLPLALAGIWMANLMANVRYWHVTDITDRRRECLL
jgi:hypothetical protein